jgi:ribulose 1,5-bisphosphate synthetase/thiazole synthase
MVAPSSLRRIRELEVVKEADVVVVGAGKAAMCAAVVD